MKRTSVIVLVLGSVFLHEPSHAQPAPLAPADRAQNFAMAILEDAEATAKHADAMWQQNRFVQVLQQYESFLGRAQSIPDATRYSPVLMVLAGAHLEIALARVSMPEFQTPSLHDEYRRLANVHISQTLDRLRSALTAASAAGPSEAEEQQFVCQVYLRLAATVALRGITNNVPADLDEGIRFYETSAPCNDSYKSAIQYLGGLKRNMTYSPLGSDAIIAFVTVVAR